MHNAQRDSMNTRIRDILDVLRSQPLIDAGRVVDLQWFHFGEKHAVKDRKGNTVEVGTYALHIQCAWRVVLNGFVYVGSSDRFFPKGAPFQEIEGFDWTAPGSNRCDERIEQLFKDTPSEELLVRDVIPDEIGGLKVVFGQNNELTIFPDISLDGEYWRFFRPYHSDKHIVVSRMGLTFE